MFAWTDKKPLRQPVFYKGKIGEIIINHHSQTTGKLQTGFRMFDQMIANKNLHCAMALLEKQLVIKKSTIKGAGKGLFTKKFIPKGTRIVEYKGKVSTWKEVDHDDGQNPYIYYINRNYVIDAKPLPKTFGRYANDADGLKKFKSIKNNARYVIDDFRVYIEAAKDIPAGGEILVRYGKEYWDVIRHNMKVNSKAAK